jgi:hypothetical protein
MVLVRYRTVQAAGLEIFLRETGAADAPVVLHCMGFPRPAICSEF